MEHVIGAPQDKTSFYGLFAILSAFCVLRCGQDASATSSGRLAEQPKYVAVIKNVEELSLEGYVDYAHWEAALRAAGLSPLVVDGGAVLLISSATLRWHGVRFTEVSFCIRAATQEMETTDFYLAKAFNSVRFFALCERWFFKTPYVHGDCRSFLRDASGGFSVLNGEDRFAAEMSSSRAPKRRASELVNCRVRLPAISTDAKNYQRFFMAQLSGETERFDFDPDTDRAEFEGAGMRDIIGPSFRPVQWLVRREAMHAKARTQSVQR